MVVKFKLCNMDTMCETYGEATVENGKATNIKIDNADKFLRYGYEIFALNKQLLATIEEDIKNGDVLLHHPYQTLKISQCLKYIFGNQSILAID